MRKNLEDYSFVDCLLIDFNFNHVDSTMYFLVESYYPYDVKGIRCKGLLKVQFFFVSNVKIEKTSEFDLDVSLPYDPEGNDERANEIYSINIKDMSELTKRGCIDSDMLKVQLEFEKIEIVELTDQ